MAADGKTNECLPLKIGPNCPKKKQSSYSKHPFSGAFDVSFREGKLRWICFLDAWKKFQVPYSPLNGGAFNGDEFIPWVPSNR